MDGRASRGAASAAASAPRPVANRRENARIEGVAVAKPSNAPSRSATTATASGSPIAAR